LSKVWGRKKCFKPSEKYSIIIIPSRWTVTHFKGLKERREVGRVGVRQGINPPFSRGK